MADRHVILSDSDLSNLIIEKMFMDWKWVVWCGHGEYNQICRNTVEYQRADPGECSSCGENYWVGPHWLAVNDTPGLGVKRELDITKPAHIDMILDKLAQHNYITIKTVWDHELENEPRELFWHVRIQNRGHLDIVGQAMEKAKHLSVAIATLRVMSVKI